MLAKLRFALHGRRGLSLCPDCLHSLSLLLLSFLLLPLVVEIVKLSIVLGSLRRVLRLAFLQFLVLHDHLVRSLLLLELSNGFLVLFDGLDVSCRRSNVLALHGDHFLRAGSHRALGRVEAVLLFGANSDWLHVLLLLTSCLKVLLMHDALHLIRFVGLHLVDHRALLQLTGSLARKSLVHIHLLAEAVDLLCSVDVSRRQRVTTRKVVR